MPTAAQHLIGSVASRSGPIHSFADDPDGLESYQAADNGAPIPVVVRSISDPGIVGKGFLTDRRIDNGELIGTVEWSADLESRIGDGQPSARCEFSPTTGRLIRMVVELDDDVDLSDDDVSGESDDHDEPDAEMSADASATSDLASGNPAPPSLGGHACGCKTESCTCPSHDPLPDLTGFRDGQPDDPLPLSPGAAAMATEHDSPEMGEEQNPHANPHTAHSNNRQGKPARDEPDDQAHRIDPEEFKRTQLALKKANDEAKRFRLENEAFKRAEEDKKTESLGESDKLKRAAEKESVARRDAEARAEAAERQVVELRLESLANREAIRLGFKYADTAFRLMDRSLLTFDEETGEWHGVAAAVEKVGAAYPDLVNKRPANPGSAPRGDYPGNPTSRRATPGNGARVINGDPTYTDPFSAVASETRYDPM